MTLKEFCLLPDREKMQALYEQGVYIGKRRVHNSPVVLYQFQGFYIEIHYRRYRHSIASVCCFTNTARLDPYLTEIDVEHLVV